MGVYFLFSFFLFHLCSRREDSFLGFLLAAIMVIAVVGA